MAAFPTLCIDDLANFTGRQASSYPDPFSDQALLQARLFFSYATGLFAKDNAWPTDPDDAQLAKYAVLSLADYFVLDQPNQQIKADVFSSQTIGSYSYTLKQAAVLKAIQLGGNTGIMWFDLAIQQFGADSNHVVTGGIEVFYDELMTEDQGNGFSRVLGPHERNPIDVPFYISRDAPFDPNRH